MHKYMNTSIYHDDHKALGQKLWKQIPTAEIISFDWYRKHEYKKKQQTNW